MLRFKTRVLATRDFVLDCLRTAVNHKAEIVKLLAQARPAPAHEAGRRREFARQSRCRSAREQGTPDKSATVLGFVEREENGRRVKTDTTKEYTLKLMNEFEGTESVARPFAYLVPPRAPRRSRISNGMVWVSRSCARTSSSTSRSTRSTRSRSRLGGSKGTTWSAELTTVSRAVAQMVPAGTLLVRTAQPLGTLAVYLLEPRSEDGLAAWNFFDADLKAGSDFPVLRLIKSVPISLDGRRAARRKLWARRGRSLSTPRASEAAAGRVGGFDGCPRWIDAEHWLDVKEKRLMKVQAATGRSEPFVDAEALAKGLSRLALARREHRAVDYLADVCRHGPREV